MSGEPITIGFDPGAGDDLSAIAVYRAADVQWPGPFSPDSPQVVCIATQSWPIEQLGTIRFGVPLHSVRTLAEAVQSAVQSEIPSLSTAAAPNPRSGVLPNPELPSVCLSFVPGPANVTEAGAAEKRPGGGFPLEATGSAAE